MSARLLQMRFAADPERLKTVRESVQQAAGRVTRVERLVNDLVIAVNEACMNIMEHAYKGDRSGEIVLEMNHNGAAIEVVITDFAPPVDLGCIEPRALDDVRPGGLGTFFIRQLVDECAYAHLHDDRGNVLRMSKRIHDQQAGDEQGSQ